MIISDLNLLETVEGAEVVGGGFNLTKNVSLTTGSTQTFNVGVNVNAQKTINSSLTSIANVVGNTSITIFDNTAQGPNSYTESNVTNTAVKNVGSESAGSLTASTI